MIELPENFSHLVALIITILSTHDSFPWEIFVENEQEQINVTSSKQIHRQETTFVPY